MYSPKIKEYLIPTIYRIAKLKRMPMTKLVSQYVQAGLANDITEDILLKEVPCIEKI